MKADAWTSGAAGGKSAGGGGVMYVAKAYRDSRPCIVRDVVWTPPHTVTTAGGEVLNLARGTITATKARTLRLPGAYRDQYHNSLYDARVVPPKNEVAIHALQARVNDALAALSQYLADHFYEWPQPPKSENQVY